MDELSALRFENIQLRAIALRYRGICQLLVGERNRKSFDLKEPMPSVLLPPHKKEPSK